jgi:DnaJ-class molecular chaperone
MRLPVSIVEATLGASVEVPLPTGGGVALKIPAGTPSGKRLRVPGKGIPASSGRPAGDFYAEIQIVPPREVDDLTRQLLDNLSGRIEDPRAREAWRR